MCYFVLGDLTLNLISGAPINLVGSILDKLPMNVQKPSVIDNLSSCHPMVLRQSTQVEVE